MIRLGSGLRPLVDPRLGLATPCCGRGHVTIPSVGRCCWIDSPPLASLTVDGTLRFGPDLNLDGLDSGARRFEIGTETEPRQAVLTRRVAGEGVMGMGAKVFGAMAGRSSCTAQAGGLDPAQRLSDRRGQPAHP
jgi:hypothetical protein